MPKAFVASVLVLLLKLVSGGLDEAYSSYRNTGPTQSVTKGTSKTGR